MNKDEISLKAHFNLCSEGGGVSVALFCGKTNDIATNLQLHRTIVEKEVNLEQANITGILIGQGNSVLHLLEGPSFTILRILSQLSAEACEGSIVFSVEDRPKRDFPEWYSCTFPEKKSSDEFTEESCKDVVFDIATKLLKIGESLRSQQSDELELSR